jgi:hypothetical protein
MERFLWICLGGAERAPVPAGWRGLKPLPEPELQRVEADEPGVRRQQRVLLTAVLGSLPSELHRVDEHQSSRYARP